MNDKKVNDWLQWVLITSVPLYRFDKDNDLVEIASGCLIDYSGKRFLLSVQHAVERTSQGWAIEVQRYDKKGGWNLEVYHLNSFNYVAEEGEILGSVSRRNIDFCFTEVPNDFVSHYQDITPNGKVLEEHIRHVFTTALDVTPSTSQVYAFSGQVSPEKIKNRKEFGTDMRVYPGLSFIGLADEYYVFKLPSKYPGCKYLKGCSGAPIIDMNRNMVAIVCSGDKTNNTILGVSPARYKLAFDMLSGKRSNYSCAKESKV